MKLNIEQFLLNSHPCQSFFNEINKMLLNNHFENVIHFENRLTEQQVETKYRATFDYKKLWLI